MREVKFRAWDRKSSKMIQDFSTMSDDYTGPFNNTIEYIQCILELMQYTGLKDKNGVEIYEGDILKDYSQNYMGVVSFQDGAFIVTWENEFCNAFEWTSEEVIGNIYENEELSK